MHLASDTKATLQIKIIRNDGTEEESPPIDAQVYLSDHPEVPQEEAIVAKR